jgi:hypothetical protein
MPQHRSCLALIALLLGAAACDSSGPNTDLGRPDTTGTDSTPTQPPPDTTGTDTTVTPPVDSGPPTPPDTGSTLPPYDPTYTGIPFGPAQQPTETLTPDFNGTILSGNPNNLIADLERARRTNTRLLINFTGKETNIRDANGFNMSIWKARVDRYRHLDLQKYIDEGTIIGHFLMDEPSDRSNWNGHQVSPAEIDEMARYSKEVWPTMPAIIRAWPDYLKAGGYQYKYLDAVRIHYLARLGDVDQFIDEMAKGAADLNLALIGGLNVLNGGSPNSGIPGRAEGKFAMSADELRSWGTKFLTKAPLCAFFVWEYDDTFTEYLKRPGIKEAFADLKKIAEDMPKKPCKK